MPCPALLPASFVVASQRLIEENKQQQEMLVQLVQRLDALEATLQVLQQKQTTSSFFGGFLGPKALI